MQKQTPLWLGALSALALAAPVWAQEMMADKVMATVNGTEITMGHLATAYANLPAQYKNLPPQMLFDGLIDQLVQQEALVQSVGDVPTQVTRQVENQTRTIIAAHAIDLAMETPISAEDVEAAYNERYANAEPAKEWNASHILVETEEEAQALVTELEAGADFAALAREKSTGPSGPNGGSLGWFGSGRMVPAFEAAVTELEVGAISAPLETQFGWHVIKLNEVRNLEAPALEDVRADIEGALRNARLEARIEELVASADVTRPDLGDVDPAMIADPDFFKK